jgi:hypothetical protein
MSPTFQLAKMKQRKEAAADPAVVDLMAALDRDADKDPED